MNFAGFPKKATLCIGQIEQSVTRSIVCGVCGKPPSPPVYAHARALTYLLGKSPQTPQEGLASSWKMGKGRYTTQTDSPRVRGAAPQCEGRFAAL